MDLVSCRQAYRSLSADIFSESWFRMPLQTYWDMWRGNPRFNPARLERTVKELVSHRISTEEREMLKKRPTQPEEAKFGGVRDDKCKR